MTTKPFISVQKNNCLQTNHQLCYKKHTLNKWNKSQTSKIRPFLLIAKWYNSSRRLDFRVFQTKKLQNPKIRKPFQMITSYKLGRSNLKWLRNISCTLLTSKRDNTTSHLSYASRYLSSSLLIDMGWQLQKNGKTWLTSQLALILKAM